MNVAERIKENRRKVQEKNRNVCRFVKIVYTVTKK